MVKSTSKEATNPFGSFQHLPLCAKNISCSFIFNVEAYGLGVGYMYVDLVVRGRVSRRVRALVDTGSAYMVLDSKTISEVGLHETPFEVELTLADKRKAKAELYLAEVEAEGRKGLVFVAEQDVPTPILGTYALETLGLKPNPVTGRLEVVGPEGGYLL
ncbi:MAG: aspartyl protease family protein [Candidatus Bathyarchaeales archaeon]